MSKKTETIVAQAPAKVSALLMEIGTLSGHVAMSRFGATPMDNVGVAIMAAQAELETGFTPVFFSTLKRVGAVMPKKSVKVQAIFDKVTAELAKAVEAGASEVIVEREARAVTAQEVDIVFVARKARANRLAK